ACASSGRSSFHAGRIRRLGRPLRAHGLKRGAAGIPLAGMTPVGLARPRRTPPIILMVSLSNHEDDPANRRCPVSGISAVVPAKPHGELVEPWDAACSASGFELRLTTHWIPSFDGMTPEGVARSIPKLSRHPRESGDLCLAEPVAFSETEIPAF